MPIKKSSPKASKKTDLENLKETVEKLKLHFQKNKHDYRTKRALQIKEAKLNKLRKYKKKKAK